METEIVSEFATETSIPAIAAETPAPIPADAPDEVITGVDGEGKINRKFGTRKVVNADGSVSYGVTKEGKVRRKPGRKPKAS